MILVSRMLVTALVLTAMAWSATAQERAEREEVAASQLADRLGGKASHEYAILESNPLYEIEELQATEVQTRVIEKPQRRDLFKAGNPLSTAQDYSMRIEHRPLEGLTLHSDSRLGVQSRFLQDDLLWGNSQETYQRVQQVGAKLQPHRAFHLGARYETRANLPQGREAIIERDRRILEGSISPWKKGTFTLGMENQTVSLWETNVRTQDKQIYRSQWKQGIASLPLTTTVGTRLTENFAPDSDQSLLDSSAPEFSGAVNWQPHQRVNLRLGARGQKIENGFGEETAEQHHVFAEYKHGLTDDLEWRSRLTLQDRANYLDGVTTTESTKTEVRVGPSWKMGEYMNADLELFRSWEDNSAVTGEEPTESRVSFSIRGEF